MMNQDDFLRLAAEAMETDDAITMDQPFTSMDNWDSIAVLSFIALVDETFDVAIKPKQIQEAVSLMDIWKSLKEGNT